MIDFSVLGPIGCVRDGAPVELGGPQQRRLLALLLSDAGHVVPLERMIDAIWGDDAPPRARRTVMSYVSRLRSALGDGFVVTAEPGYRLDLGEHELDAIRFETLIDRSRHVPPSEAISVIDRALELWRGPAYGEFASEWWAVPVAARLEGMRLAATAERIEALLTTGDRSRAVADLEALVPAHPLDDRLVAQLMRAYEAEGRKPEALRAFQDHRARLAEETGLAPGATLTALEQAIVLDTGLAPVEPDRVLRGYVLGDVIGHGAHGTVYRSVQPGVDRPVAVKVIRADRADDPGFVQQFEAAAQLVAHLEHPHIVPLYDFWREPGGAYLVFRLLTGGSAKDAQADGPWPLDRVTRLLDEIGGALVAAHASGVVHRDVKPSNVLFDSTGNSYLVDFDIAIEHRCDAQRSLASSPGSRRYAPPEVFRDDAFTPASDQFSLAVVVHEFLHGAPPHVRTSTGPASDGRRSSPRAPIARFSPGLPPGLDEVLRRARSANCADRYPDIATMVEEWHGALRGSGASSVNGGASAGAHHQGTVPRESAGGTGSNPYVGLRPFSEADAQSFRGRDLLADELTAAVRSGGMAMVVGASGGGKSSLVHAGLVPRLRGGGDRIASMVPGEDPQAQLGLALLRVARRTPLAEGAADMVREVAAEGHGALTVVIDQFEELWTLTNATDRRTFIANLVSLVNEPGTTPIRLVMAVRADFFDRPLAEPELGPLVRAHTFLVTPMSAAELHEAITGPAAALGVNFEQGLDSRLVADTIDSPASLPLLQFTLSELFVRRTGAVIPRSAYDELGGIAGAVAHRAETLYATLDEADADAARRLLVRLVVPGDGTEDTRRRVRRSDLPDGTVEMADLLQRHRLLSGDHDPTTREPTVEIAHESLLRSWPRLRGWLGEDRDALRAIQHLSQSAKAWEDAGHPDSELYRGGRLEVASALAANRPDQLSPLESDFVRVSHDRTAASQERERRTRRRTHRLLAGTAVALVVAVVAGSVAFVQRREANQRAEDVDVERLISLSQSLVTTKRDVAALLAVAASRRRPGSATDGALMTAVYSDPSYVGDLRSGFSRGSEIAPSRDGRFLWAAPDINGEPAVRWDLATRQTRLFPIPEQGDLAVHFFVPVTTTTAVVVLDDERGDVPAASKIRLVDLETQAELATFDFGGEDRATDLRVSPDGTRVLATGRGTDARPTRVVVLSLPDLEEVASVDQPGPPTAEPAWWSQSAWLDDERVATGSPSGRIAIWSPSTGQVVGRINDPPPPGLNVANHIQATSDASTLITANDQGDGLMAFDVDTGEAMWERPADANMISAIDEQNGLIYAQESGVGSSRLFAYELATGVRTQRRLDGQQGSICSMHTLPEQRVLAVSSCNTGSVALFALDGATPAGTPIAPPGWFTGPGLWSPDGNLVVAYQEFDGGSIAIHDLRTGEDHAPPADYVDGPAWFDPDGTMWNLSPGAQAIYNVRPSGKVESRVDAAIPADIEEVTTSIEAGLVAFAHGGDEQITVMELATGDVVTTIEPQSSYIHGLAMSSDGKRLYTAGQDERGRVFELPSGKLVGEIDRLTNVALSPDGSLLAGGRFDGVIALFDPLTLEPLGDPLTGATAFSNSIQFTPDGRFIVTSGLDNTLRIWDVETRLQVGPGLPVIHWGAAISGDSKEIAFTNEVGVQRISLDRGHLRRAACTNAARNLTADEWRRYIGETPEQLCAG